MGDAIRMGRYRSGSADFDSDGSSSAWRGRFCCSSAGFLADLWYYSGNLIGARISGVLGHRRGWDGCDGAFLSVPRSEFEECLYAPCEGSCLASSYFEQCWYCWFFVARDLCRLFDWSRYPASFSCRTWIVADGGRSYGSQSVSDPDSSFGGFDCAGHNSWRAWLRVGLQRATKSSIITGFLSSCFHRVGTELHYRAGGTVRSKSLTVSSTMSHEEKWQKIVFFLVEELH